MAVLEARDIDFRTAERAEGGAPVAVPVLVDRVLAALLVAGLDVVVDAVKREGLLAGAVWDFEGVTEGRRPAPALAMATLGGIDMVV